jgi:hypothetical protein
MSAWVIGLGLSAGYLINKNVSIKTQLETSATQYNSAAKPATGGVTSAEVRKAYKSKEHVKYGDMNTDLPKKQQEGLDRKQQDLAEEAYVYDAGGVPLPVIQGVLLQFDRCGV